jgi:hypothetical protein
MPSTSTCMTPGTTNDACGPLGGACTNCSAENKICEAATRACVDRPQECDPAEAFSCSGQETYCDKEGVCRNCPRVDNQATYNCDGDNANACERDTACDDPGCSETPTWPTSSLVANTNSLPSGGYWTQAEVPLTDPPADPYVLLRVEINHSDPSFTGIETFSTSTSLDSSVRAFVFKDCEGYTASLADNYFSCDTMFLAQAGTANIEQAEQGTFKATLSNLELVEWNEFDDEPAANGACWHVNSAVLDTTP